MIECNFIECNVYPNLNATALSAAPLNAIPLSNQQQFRLNKINEIKDYFVAEIKERELMSKRPRKNIGDLLYYL